MTWERISLGPTPFARPTFSRHMIASFIKGIKSAFETKPGTSCDVVTSNPTISSCTPRPIASLYLYHTPPQTHATGRAYLETFAPPI